MAQSVSTMPAEEIEDYLDGEEEAASEELHRMPDYIQRRLMRIDGKLYLPAAARIVWFRDEHPDWTIMTSILEGGITDGKVVVQAVVMDETGRVIAQDMAAETKEGFKYGFIEKASTNAASRALSLCGYGTQFMPELDELSHPADSPQSLGSGKQGNGATVWEGPGNCPECRAPEGKAHGTNCPKRSR